MGKRLKQIFIAFVLVIFSTGFAYSQNLKTPPLKHFEVVRGDDSKISAYISVPARRKSGVVLFLQGSICNSERENSLRLIDDWRNKYAVLYIEKPGVEWGQESCPDYYLKHNTIDQRLWDIQTVIAQIRKEKWFNGNIYVIGASEGGLMAGLTGASVPEVKKIAILSYGGGMTMSEMWGKLTYEGVIKDTGSKEEAQKESDSVKTAFGEARVNPSFGKTFSGNTNTYAWWHSIIDIRLVNYLINIDVPIYLYHGDKDQFDDIESARKTHDVFMDNGKSNLEYHELKGLDHGFNEENGKSHLEQVYLEAIRKLLN